VRARWLLALLLPPAALSGLALALGAGATALHVAATADLSYFALLVLLRVRRRWPPSGARLRPPARPSSRSTGLPPLDTIDAAILFSQTSGLDFELLLRPALFAIAAARLKRRGIDVSTSPEQAELILGPRVWGVLRPPEQRPDRRAPGLRLQEIETVVRVLEEV
jgi:hypothetical protein